MNTSDEQARYLHSVLMKMVDQGLPPDLALQAHECAMQLFNLLVEYESAGLVALGIVSATVDEIIANK